MRIEYKTRTARSMRSSAGYTTIVPATIVGILNVLDTVGRTLCAINVEFVITDLRVRIEVELGWTVSSLCHFVFAIIVRTARLCVLHELAISSSCTGWTNLTTDTQYSREKYQRQYHDWS